MRTLTTQERIIFACYTGSAPFRTAAEIAARVDLPENQVLAELDELIKLGRVTQLTNSAGAYVFANSACLPKKG